MGHVTDDERRCRAQFWGWESPTLTSSSSGRLSGSALARSATPTYCARWTLLEPPSAVSSHAARLEPAGLGTSKRQRRELRGRIRSDRENELLPDIAEAVSRDSLPIQVGMSSVTKSLPGRSTASIPGFAVFRRRMFPRNSALFRGLMVSRELRRCREDCERTCDLMMLPHPGR